MYFTESLSSAKAGAIRLITEEFPRRPSASRAAVRTSSLLSVVAAWTSTSSVAESESLARTLAAAARTGELSSFTIVLMALYPMPANGTNPIPS